MGLLYDISVTGSSGGCPRFRSLSPSLFTMRCDAFISVETLGAGSNKKLTIRHNLLSYLCDTQL